MKISVLPFYGLFSDSGRSIFEQNLKSLFCTQGQVVHENSGELYGFLFVEDGVLSVSLLSEDGREVTLFRIRKGEYCFLPVEPLSGISFDLTAEAESDARLCVLSGATLASLMERDPAFQGFVHQSMMKHFSCVLKLLQSVLFSSFEERLASFLYREMTATGSATLSLTHEQIARHIGSAREVVSRELKRFSTLGIVTAMRGSVTVIDPDGLKRLVDR